MNYQGEQVNFSQPTMTQYNTANIERINKSMYEYPQQIGLASEKSDSDIWKWLGMYVNGTSGENSQGSWGANQNAIMPKLDRAVDKNTSQDESIMNNKMQIEAINARLSKQVTDLGNALTGKAGINHTHSGGGGDDPKDCGWFGEKCWDNPFEKLFPTVPMTAILAAGGLGAYLLLRKK